MRKRTKHTGSFTATDPSGRRYDLHIYTTYIDATDSGGHGEIAETSSMKTLDGLHVNRLGKGLYEIAATGLSLTSSDPSAP
jgi:hypothetical protein